MNKEGVKQYVIERAKEASTWRGIVLVLTGLGVSIAPAQIEAIVTFGTVLAGLLGAAFPDKS